jgi:hypothetical protein
MSFGLILSKNRLKKSSSFLFVWQTSQFTAKSSKWIWWSILLVLVLTMVQVKGQIPGNPHKGVNLFSLLLLLLCMHKLAPPTLCAVVSTEEPCFGESGFFWWGRLTCTSWLRFFFGVGSCGGSGPELNFQIGLIWDQKVDTSGKELEIGCWRWKTTKLIWDSEA